MQLLATVLGQDLETGAGGVLRIARTVATDRVICTVDPQARHGHKSSHHSFDGYQAHIARVDAVLAAHAGAAAAVAAAREVGEFAFDFRAGGAVVGLPDGRAAVRSVSQ
jgi:hypothetical protein